MKTTRLLYNKVLDEWTVQVLVNGVRRPYLDFTTNSEADAREVAADVEADRPYGDAVYKKQRTLIKQLLRKD